MARRSLRSSRTPNRPVCSSRHRGSGIREGRRDRRLRAESDSGARRVESEAVDRKEVAHPPRLFLARRSLWRATASKFRPTSRRAARAQARATSSGCCSTAATTARHRPAGRFRPLSSARAPLRRKATSASTRCGRSRQLRTISRADSSSSRRTKFSTTDAAIPETPGRVTDPPLRIRRRSRQTVRHDPDGIPGAAPAHVQQGLGAGDGAPRADDEPDDPGGRLRGTRRRSVRVCAWCDPDGRHARRKADGRRVQPAEAVEKTSGACRI
jgi:hypothetical protein